MLGRQIVRVAAGRVPMQRVLPLVRLSSAPAGPAAPSEPQDKKLSSWGKIKELSRKYGPTAFVVHTTVYITTLSTIFLGVHTNVIAAESMVLWLQSAFDSLHLGWLFHGSEAASSAGMEIPKQQQPTFGGNLAAAWIITKFTEPIRIPLTVYLTPKVAKVIQFKMPFSGNSKSQS